MLTTPTKKMKTTTESNRAVNGVKDRPQRGDLWVDGWCHDCDAFRVVRRKDTRMGSENYECQACHNVGEKSKGSWWRKVVGQDRSLNHLHCFVVMSESRYFGIDSTLSGAAWLCLGPATDKVAAWILSYPNEEARHDISVDEMGGIRYHHDTICTLLFSASGVKLGALRRTKE